VKWINCCHGAGSLFEFIQLNSFTELFESCSGLLSFKHNNVPASQLCLLRRLAASAIGITETRSINFRNVFVHSHITFIISVCKSTKVNQEFPYNDERACLILLSKFTGPGKENSLASLPASCRSVPQEIQSLFKSPISEFAPQGIWAKNSKVVRWQLCQSLTPKLTISLSSGVFCRYHFFGWERVCLLAIAFANQVDMAVTLLRSGILFAK
jgi:hypothetical protein